MSADGFEQAAEHAAKAMGMSVTDARELLAKAAGIEQPAAYKRARFDAEGAMGQHFAYRKGARSRKDEQR